MDTIKIRCPVCLCFNLVDGNLRDGIVTPDTLIEPTDHCDVRIATGTPCSCHTGISAGPRIPYDVISLNESAESHANRYKRIDRIH